ncbi:DUF1156 domain-containing protein [Methanoplanus limicola]|uniref:DUF1156 domain-containing protein n=1 Tax=Methanoplanus limicola DSM 2279 TaxID=937775 RepID=H1YYL0_9EURY|nr:DUF1156 domain-containing protein [Methanoplanus limicola]EHQ35993.1 protein of unknown function DUF1156 [Methanoplanus limicola DSM 2279]
MAKVPEIKAPKKLIEVALPLDEINAACKKEGNPFTPRHPRSLHIWWARRRIAAVRAVLFAQLVNDPGYERELGRGVNKEKAEAERKRLFEIIKKLVLWENTNNEQVLAEARAEIMKSWRETCELNKKHPQAKELFNPEKLPAFHDPFAGGGAIPLEAQRLGLEAWASDLNPVAVLINKAMIEIPPKFAGNPPVNPESKEQIRVDDSEWKGAAGLAEDVRYYGQWMRDEAEKKIGHLYPKVRITEEMAEDRPDLKQYAGEELTVIAWLWARTVKCPNPACGGRAPLLRSFHLSKKKGKEVHVIPEIDKNIPAVKRFRVESKGDVPENTTDAKGARCLFCGTFIKKAELREISKKDGLESIPLAIVAKGKKGRVYLSSDLFEVPDIKKPDVPEANKPMTNDHRWFSPPLYGLPNFSDIFTPRQLTALTTFSDLVKEAREKALNDAIAAGMPDDKTGLEDGGTGAAAYADSICIYLALSLSRWTDLTNSLVSWNNVNQNFRALFARQAIPMVWDYAESNPFGPIASWYSIIESQINLNKSLSAFNLGYSTQKNAMIQDLSSNKIISTDPPYYDNIGYADLSDFFYVWLRTFLRFILPVTLITVNTPKSEELVAASYSHGSKGDAEEFFMEGMNKAMHRLAEQANPLFPVTIYYAFKQSETKEGNTSSSGWETFLEAVIKSGFAIKGTWPMHTERTERSVAMNTNALASSIVLVCRKRGDDADVVSRKEFLKELKRELPEALDEMTASSIAPVDLAQASIGPGMAVFSKYSAVLEADGTKMTVHDALVLINRELDEYFSEAGDDFDADTRFCLAWFDENSWKEGRFGEADGLARAKGTSVDGVKEAGVIESGSGKVRLYRWSEYPDDWSPEKDSRTPVWEALHHLIRVHQCGGGEAGAADLLSRMSGRALSIKQLAYRLYTLCERKGWAEDARPYNELITSWGEVEARTPEAVSKTPQKNLDSF